MATENRQRESTTAIADSGESSLACRVQEALAGYRPISLAEMDGVALMDRTDTKYIVPASSLAGLLERLAGKYRALEIRRRRLNHYRTVYFDTEDMAFYLRHHAGNEVRVKVRSREYTDSRLSYLEVKRKTNKDRTVKERLQTPEPVTQASRQVDDFLLSQYPLAEPGLSPKLSNGFSRATLVSNHGPERLTLDIDLSFEGNGRTASLPGVAIIEVKQARFDRTSPVISGMRALGIPPRGISKYCIGVALLYPEIKHNAFKPRLLLLNQLMRGEQSV